jgi:hypothetical protein
MAEDKPRSRPQLKPESEIASAELLFRDDPGAKPAKPAQKPGAAGGAAEVFDLVEGTEPAEPDTVAPAPPVPVAPARQEAARPKTPKVDRAQPQREPDPSELVQEVWTRKGEWGPTLLVVGSWVTFIVLIVYFVLGLEHFGLSFLTLVIGGLIAAVLSYPMLITLERPVRITPEQALRDYYAALSHHLPHFRRMWLLLSSAARSSTAFGSFEGFKRYWREHLKGLKAGHAGTLTPLVFEIADFDGDKSAGMNRVAAGFTLKVYVRGRRQAGTIHSVPMRIGLARGPDKMWYLENGTLTRSERTGRGR